MKSAISLNKHLEGEGNMISCSLGCPYYVAEASLDHPTSPLPLLELQACATLSLNKHILARNNQF